MAFKTAHRLFVSAKAQPPKAFFTLEASNVELGGGGSKALGRSASKMCFALRPVVPFIILIEVEGSILFYVSPRESTPIDRRPPKHHALLGVLWVGSPGCWVAADCLALAVGTLPNRLQPATMETQ